jgi:hypothetical protein
MSDDETTRRVGDALADSMGIDADSLEREVSCKGCGVFVPISPLAWDLAKKFSEMLMAKGEPPLDEGELMYCQPCWVRHMAKRAELDKGRDDRVAQIVADAKLAGKMPDDIALQWLRRNRYFDIEPMLKGYFERLAKGPKGPSKGKRGADR